MARSEPNGRGTPGRIGIWQRVTVSAISFPACFRLDGRFRTGAHNPVPDSAQPRAFGLACVARGLAGMLLLVALAGAVASALPSVAGAASLTTSVSAVQTLTCPSGERIWSGDEPNCVPITCPAGTVHDSDSGYCVKPPPPPPPPPTAKWDSFPSDIGPVEATGPGGAPVTYSLPTADIGGTSLAVSCTPVSGSTFPVGATSVNCSATGLSNSFQVTVADTKPPTINLTGYPAGNVDTGTTVSFSASATDTVDGNTDPVTCQPASGFTSATATTVTVSCSATDNAKNAASASFNVTFVATPGSGGGGGGGGGGGTGGGSGTTVATPTISAPVVSVSTPITIPTKPTKLQKPPPPPKPVPPKYGLIKSVHETRSAKTLTVVFRFSRVPLAGAQLRATWYYNNKREGQAVKKRRPTISTGVSSNYKLTAGYWRIALDVKLPGGSWHTVKEARILLR